MHYSHAASDCLVMTTPRVAGSQNIQQFIF